MATVDNTPANGVQTFPYRSLNTDKAEIRLLTLATGKFDDSIEITLRTWSLDEELYFEALSYDWGSEKSPTPIHICDYPHVISSNLEIALRHLRSNEVPRVLWIDALCINQQDLDEKANQVQLTNRIYSSAKKVLIWLGPKDDTRDTVMSIMLNQGKN